MKTLVLSLFPGLGLLDLAFEAAGFCVVRAPDLLWGGDVRSFTVPSGRFDGVIGGPPCKRWSRLANIVRARYGEEALAPDMIPEFERVVGEAAPSWFLMENVERAPIPAIDGFMVHDQLINNRWCGGVQNRMRRFCFGTPDGRALVVPRMPEPAQYRPAVTTNSGGRRAVQKVLPNGRVVGKQGHADHCRLSYRDVGDMADDQGVPRAWFERLRKHGAFTIGALRTGIGNGVPLPMGSAVAAAVCEAIATTKVMAT